MIVPVVLADYAATLDVSDRSEARLRSTQQLSAAPGATVAQSVVLGLDLMTTPRVVLHLSDRVWDWTLSYTPSVLAPDLELGLQPLVYQNASATVAWHDRLARVMVGQDAGYGQQNSGYLVPPQASPGQPTTPTVLQPTAAPVTLNYGSAHTYVLGSLRLGRRSIVSAGVDYLLSGGIDDASRAVTPLSYGPRASATFSYTLSRVDTLLTTGSFQHTDFTATTCVLPAGETPPPSGMCTPRVSLGLAEETFSHRWSRVVSMTVGAGAAAEGVQSTSEFPVSFSLAPLADASVAMRFGHEGTGELRLTAHLGPFVNILNGVVDESLLGEVSLLYPLSGRVALRCKVMGGQTIPSTAPAAATLVSGDLEVDYHVTRAVDLALGERGFWQDEVGLGTYFSTFGFAAVTVHPPLLHL
jgi:hypothetical protein